MAEYLVMGFVLIAVSVAQLWLNGRWPFRGARSGAGGRVTGAAQGRIEGDGANPGDGAAIGEAGGAAAIGEAKAASTGGGASASRDVGAARAGRSPKRGDIWRSWTRIAGYVGIAAGIFVIVVGMVRT